MATNLSRQLTRLKTLQKDEPRIPKKAVASFLFDIQEAAHIDVGTLYSLAQSGINDISSLTPQITKFIETFLALLLKLLTDSHKLLMNLSKLIMI